MPRAKSRPAATTPIQAPRQRETRPPDSATGVARALVSQRDHRVAVRSKPNWLLVAGVGLLGALAMYAIMKPLLAAELCPFNVAPSAAFALAFELPAPAWMGLAIHFGYGALGSLLLVTLMRQLKLAITIWHGLGFAALLWLILMLGYSPLLGWGYFGFHATGTALPPDHPLHLSRPIEYLVATFTLHVVYGAILGSLNRKMLTRTTT